MLKKDGKGKDESFQNPHQTGITSARHLEESIGREVKSYREKLHLTISELAKAAGMSAGMLSKIENGATSPSRAPCWA